MEKEIEKNRKRKLDEKLIVTLEDYNDLIDEITESECESEMDDVNEINKNKTKFIKQNKNVVHDFTQEEPNSRPRKRNRKS